MKSRRHCHESASYHAGNERGDNGIRQAKVRSLPRIGKRSCQGSLAALPWTQKHHDRIAIQGGLDSLEVCLSC
jgi:hypothetical protein